MYEVKAVRKNPPVWGVFDVETQKRVVLFLKRGEQVIVLRGSALLSNAEIAQLP